MVEVRYRRCSKRQWMTRRAAPLAIATDASNPLAGVRFAPPALGPAEVAAAVAVLESGWLTTGPQVAAFEREFAAFVGAPHAVAVNSGTAALHVSLLAAGIGAGDEVITTPLTFCATANAIIHTGARPVFVDVEPETGNIDLGQVAAAVTARTKAVVPVHFAGRPVRMSGLQAVAGRHGLTLVEDAAHCVEGVSEHRKVGAIGDFTCFSFYATKNLTTGEGGMVTTMDARAATFMRTVSLHGLSRSAWTRYAPGGRSDYTVLMAGFKYNMMDVQAAIGRCQLARLDEMHAARTRIWSAYDAAFAALPLSRPAPVSEGDRHARHLYTIGVDPERAGRTRDDVERRLGDRGVATSRHFRALHLHSYYQERFNLSRGLFPVAERISDTTLSLPLSAGLTTDEVDRVIEAVHDCFR